MRALVLGLAAAALLPFGAQAIELADAAAIRWIAKREVKALQRDHGDAAYTFVSPSAHAIFPDKEAYMRTMLENFGPLLYATAFELGDLRETSQGVAQEVQFSDRRGRPFIAFFFFEKRDDTGWVIKHMIMSPLKAMSV